MEALIYLANFIYLYSYLVQDILRLRVLTIIAAICLVVYFYCREEPLITVVCWNLVFVGLNAIQILRLVRTRRGSVAASRNVMVSPQVPQSGQYPAFLQISSKLYRPHRPILNHTQ